ncbi:MAG TPA: hypothetical protein VN669_08485 [Candidatus Acidoferrales bacterium]|nr:hypothetical protein [Candidatus Acidoferrales bacterium]
MAIWQFRLILLSKKPILASFGSPPLILDQAIAEEHCWWSDVQPTLGFEKFIDLILPTSNSWSKSMRLWGDEEGDNAYVCYIDDTKSAVEEIGFRIDVRSHYSDFVDMICTLARQLSCLLMTAEYKVLFPEKDDILREIQASTAQRYLQEPEKTLRELGNKDFTYLLKKRKNNGG